MSGQATRSRDAGLERIGQVPRAIPIGLRSARGSRLPAMFALSKRPPPAELAPWVEGIWSCAVPGPLSDRYAAGPHTELIVRVENDGAATPFVSGPTASFTEFTLQRACSLFGVTFRPGVGARLLGADSPALF